MLVYVVAGFIIFWESVGIQIMKKSHMGPTRSFNITTYFVNDPWERKMITVDIHVFFLLNLIPTE